jgi:predicted metal-dependent enzyme (double-stranded beta helix superfamily)
MFDPEEFVAHCREALTDPDPAGAIHDVVARAVSTPGPLPPPASSRGGGPVLLFQSPQLTVQCIVWPTGVITPPHEHLMWAVVGVLEGEEENELWRRTAGGLERAGRLSVRAGEAVVFDAEAIHAVANPCHFPTVGLHVYGGDILTTRRSEWDFDGRNEHDFDLANVARFVATLAHRAEELGRDLDFDEVRRACLEVSRAETVR